MFTASDDKWCQRIHNICTDDCRDALYNCIDNCRRLGDPRQIEECRQRCSQEYTACRERCQKDLEQCIGAPG
jgi:hypothetical protein